MKIVFLAQNSSLEAHWSRCKSSWYSYVFDMGLLSDVLSTLKPGLKRVNNGTVLTDRKLSEVPEIFENVAMMSLGEAKSRGRQFLKTWYPADPKESPAVAPEEGACIDVLVGDLEGEVKWYLAAWRGVHYYFDDPVSVATISIFVKRAQRLANSFIRQPQSYCRSQ